MPTVDVKFAVVGSEIPADHAYPLFSAISRVLDWIHGSPEIGIHPIAGRPAGARMLRIGRASWLTLRVPDHAIAKVLSLVGKRLDLHGRPLVVGVPEIHPLTPAPMVAARIVTIKNGMSPEGFLKGVGEQFRAIDVRGTASLVSPKRASTVEGRVRPPAKDEPRVVRRTVRVSGKEIVGFALRVEGLRESESIRLQERGVGGRRHFGCGIFVPVRERTT